MLKVHQFISVMLTTACLHHRSAMSHKEFFKLCERMQHQITSRSKGLVEVSTKYQGHQYNVVCGWALKYLSTGSPC
jgi:hypothetical protein